ncbi:MAG: hypothetical protein ACRDJN_17955 [Chloroflexota bacterium]
MPSTFRSLMSEPPQDQTDLRRLITTIEGMAAQDERKAVAARDLLEKLRAQLPPRPPGRRPAA